MTSPTTTVVQRNQIYNVDCTTFMKRVHIDNIQVDIIVTSPPYNIGKKYNVYNDNKNPKDFLHWIREDVAKPSLNILKDDGSFFLNIGGKFSDPLFPLQVLIEFTNAGYRLQNHIIWAKSISIPTTKNENGTNNYNSIGHFQPTKSPLYLNNLHENIFRLTKTGQVKLDKGVGVPYQDKSNIDRWKGTNGKESRDMGNIWLLPYETIWEHRAHPSVFPIELPERCIKTHGIKQQQQQQDKNKILVYDPFMGIGTTALACLRLGVDYLGTEIDPEYCRIASMALEQKTLF